MDGAEEEEGAQVPPIATTPPHPGMKEDLLSQSSSGTQLSNASGFSLGELIRQKSIINREMDVWYRPCTEIDTSNMTVATGQKLDQTSGTCELPEFPSMEEGLITLTEDSRRQHAPNFTHPVLLEIQDSCLSPNLPLMTTCSTQGRTLFNETFFQKTGMDFVPLRGTPDVSSTASQEPLQMSESMQLAATEVDSDFSSNSFTLSKHPHAGYPGVKSNTNLASSLLQQSHSSFGQTRMEKERANEEQVPRLNVGTKTLISKNDSFGTLGSQKLRSQQLASSLPPKVSQEIVSGPDMFLLDSNVPAPFLLEMLEKEVGISKHYRFLSSSESSSCRSVLEKDSEENEMSCLAENVVLAEREPEMFVVPPQGRTFSELDSLSKKKEIASAVTDCTFNAAAPLQSVVGAEDGDPRRELVSAVAGIQTGASKMELTLSGFSVEREHKDTHISPSFNERSFFGSFAHPAHHSTPAILPTRGLKQELPGTALPVQPVFPSPLSHLHEETSKNSYANAYIPSVEELRAPSVDGSVQPPAEEPFDLQSRQETKCENSESFRALHQLKGRIQSLPSLNFMEKVGAWNVSESTERMSDALALGVSSGISPRQKAYSAIADSLNRILLNQQYQINLGEGLTASFRGPNTVFSLHSYDKKSPCALPLTRSQSENSVMVIDRELSRTDASQEMKDGLQSAKASDSGLGTGVKRSDTDVEDPIIQQYKAVLVSTVSSDEETIESVDRGRGSDPDPFITSERVAELLREEATSLGGDQDNTNEMSGSHQMGMDHFSDVSPDSLNQIISSGAGSCADLRPPSRLCSRRSSAVSGKLHSSLEADAKTPDEIREMNIEERIPVYLHNLGIDQSPSSILTPFMPRGPIREIELSPTELRTLKASTDALMQRLQSSEGDSQSVIDVMQSSFNSSTLSVPVPEGSNAAADTSWPTELSTKSSRDLLSQCSVICQRLEPYALKSCLPEVTSKSPAVPESAEQIIPVVLSNFHSGNERSPECIQMLANTYDMRKLCVDQEKLASSCLPPKKDGVNISEEISSSSILPEGERDDSSIGSKTLKEIDKLLAESETRTPSRDSNSVLSGSSSQDMSSSPMQMKEVDISKGSVGESRPGLRRIWSWDENLAREKVHKDSVLPQILCLTGSLKWKGSLPANSSDPIVLEQSRATYQIADEEHEVAEHIRRSEPEGCNSVGVNASLPAFVSSAGDTSLCSPSNLQELQAVSIPEPLDSTSDILGDVRQVLEKTREADCKGIGSNHESENGSSVDSLGIQVKNLLQHGHPVTHAIPWAKEEEHSGFAKKPVLVEAGAASCKGDAGIQECDKSSSLDSLAARVKTLLEDECPVKHATQILQSAEEEEKKVRAWVKLKLAAQSPDTVPAPNEDQLTLEVIKKEHFLNARRAGITKDQLWEDGCKRISIPSPVETLCPGPSKRPDASELHQTHSVSPKVDVVQADTALPGGTDAGTDTVLPGDSETNSLKSNTPACNQLQAHSDNSFDTIQNSYARLCNETNAHLMGLTEALSVAKASNSAMEHLTADGSSAEAATQITSITFASRKRSPSSPTSPVSCAGLSEAVPGGLLSLEAQSVNTEQVNSSKQQLESPKPCAIASPSASRALEKDVVVSSSRDHSPHVAIAISEDGSHQEKPTLLAEDSQTKYVEQRVCSVRDNSEKDWATSQVATRLKKHDRPISGGYEKEFNSGETVTGQLLSINVPGQSTDRVCPQDQLTNGLERRVHMPKPFIPESKESVLTKEGKFTFDSFSRMTGDTHTENSELSPSSPDHVAVIKPVSPSSPTRKALSGVHITLSPRRVDLDVQSRMNTGAEVRQGDSLKTGPHQKAPSAPGLSLEVKRTELPPKSLDFAYFPRTASSPDCHFRDSNILFEAKHAPYQSLELGKSRHKCSVHDQGRVRVLDSGGQHLEDNCKITASSQTERLSSDAITQITTEGPQKTTYSAEIFVGTDNDEVGTPRPSQHKSYKVPTTSAPPLNQVSILNREAGKPLLLPYKPPGSSEMYYVPCTKEALKLSRIRSETTMESTHSGSNDAIPPEFPAQVLGCRSENPPDAVAIKHREGIYSKRTAPKVAWTDGKTATQGDGKVIAQNRNPLESVKTTHSVFRSAQFYLHQPVPLQHEIDFAGSEALGPYPESGRSTPASGNLFQYKEMPERNEASFPLHWPRGEDTFSPLNAEPDYSLIEDSRFSKSFERDAIRKELAHREVRKTGHKVAKDLPLPGSHITSPKLNLVSALPVKQRVPFTASLDELWNKYLERQKQHQQQHPDGGSRHELSLVERLDRLARLLQNPVRQSLMSAKERKTNVQEERRRKEPKKARSQGKEKHKVSLASHHRIRGAEESPDSTSNEQLLKSGQRKSGAAPTAGHSSRNLEEQHSEMPSDTSSELRTTRESSVLTDISTSESDVATQAEMETATQTEESISVSTIDTARLVRAFGHDRVQVSPKLSQLYSTITLQKSRSETWAKGNRRAMAADYPKAGQVTDSVFSSDSISTVTSSRGPSPALNNKRNTRMLNKAVQAGDLEIVHSATKKNTRDVGLTFPTPTSSQVRLRGAPLNGTEPDRFVSGSKGAQKRLPGSFLAERPRRSKHQWLQGMSWFVPAEDLKSNSKQGNGSYFIPDANPSWFEPVTSSKPWREPLREKNSQEEHGGLQVRLMAPARDIENKPPPPFVKMTLQDALALHRPDFITSSGERVKRLKLIMEERKLQSVLQNEREELFNPPEERRMYRNSGCLYPNRDYRAIQRRRTISKNEMVQRSKRIYEQLPEVRKRREEEKRKSDYSTYRLKAQLYKTKITNRLLGRKVPWE